MPDAEGSVLRVAVSWHASHSRRTGRKRYRAKATYIDGLGIFDHCE
jgi:hypothetical protein